MANRKRPTIIELHTLFTVELDHFSEEVCDGMLVLRIVRVEEGVDRSEMEVEILLGFLNNT
jgi:hypothetical protein